VVGLWRYSVTSMMGEELNTAELTDRGLVGDRRFAVVDGAIGKVAGAKNPRKCRNFRLSSGIRRASPRSPKYGKAVMRPEGYLTEGTPRLHHFAEVAADLAGLDG
jgi:uncharacterized protein